MVINIKSTLNKKQLLIIEYFSLYIILPSIYVIFNLDSWFKLMFQGKWLLLYQMHKIILLQIMFIYTLFIYSLKIRNYNYFKFSNLINNISYIKNIFKRLLIITIILLIFTYFVFPNHLFETFKLYNIKILLLVFFFYPLLSVIQQEFIYRIFFYERYKEFFPKIKELVISNSLVFMFVHIIYENWFSLFTTFIGNFLFISTFIRTKSFYFILIEHSLYGLIIFYIGLGNFFYKTHTLKIF